MSQINPNKIVETGVLKMSPYSKIQQVGIDLSVSKAIFIPKGESLNVLLNEIVKLPSNIYAMLYGRSSFNRKGILIRGSVYDPGYEGQVGCTIYNMSPSNLFLEKDERICQMMFFSADAASSYEGQYQGEHLKKEETSKSEIEKKREAVWAIRDRKTFPDNY